MADVELRLNFIGGTALTLAVDEATLQSVLDAYKRRDGSTCTLSHGKWTWTFHYDAVVAIGHKTTSRGGLPNGPYVTQQWRGGLIGRS